MRFNELQIKSISNYFVDLSKIIFASTVVGFFLPNSADSVNLMTFIFGSMFAFIFLLLALLLLKTEKIKIN